MIDQSEFAAYIIGWMVCAPFASALAVYIYMRVRYREGIVWQQHFSKGLFK